jgi:hypothetical protein
MIELQLIQLTQSGPLGASVPRGPGKQKISISMQKRE